MPPEAVAEAYASYEAGESATAPLTAAALSSQTIHESMKILLLVRVGKGGKGKRRVRVF